MTFKLLLSRARTGVVAMRQDSSYYNNWIPQNWGEKGVKIQKKDNYWAKYRNRAACVNAASVPGNES
jgi:hypothetical protein